MQIIFNAINKPLYAAALNRSLTPGLVIAHVNLAVSYLDDGAADRAVFHYQKAVDLGYKGKGSLSERITRLKETKNDKYK
ncbi:MAG: hypothetical protein ABH872_04615 [Candidatus Omnitrophota bacterium]